MTSLSLKDFQISSPHCAAHSIIRADSALPCFNPPLELFCKCYFAFEAAFQTISLNFHLRVQSTWKKKHISVLITVQTCVFGNGFHRSCLDNLPNIILNKVVSSRNLTKVTSSFLPTITSPNKMSCGINLHLLQKTNTLIFIFLLEGIKSSLLVSITFNATNLFQKA